MRYGGRADAFVSMVYAGDQAGCHRPIDRQQGDCGGRAGRHEILSATLGKYLFRLDAEYPGLVHLAPTVVGPSDPRLLVRALPRRGADCRRDTAARLPVLWGRRPATG